MPRTQSASPSRHNGTSASAQSKRRSSDVVQKAPTPATDVGQVQDEDIGDDGDDEPEYEVERIVKHRKEPNGTCSYYVSWKGYDASENSWVHESDADGIRELIAVFWQKLKKEKRDEPIRSSISRTSRARSSTARQVSSEVEDSSLSNSKKRGRKPRTSRGDSDVEMDLEQTKKAKKPKPEKPAQDKDEDEGAEAGSMAEYYHLDSWEHLIKGIDTVERVEETNDLMVYFRLNDGRQMREDSTKCAKTFPQKLIKFYESNLRWKMTDDA